MGATFFDRPPVTARRYVFRPPFTVVKVDLLNGWPHPSGHRLGIADPEVDLPPDVTGQPPLERLTRPGRRQDRVQHRPAACIDRRVSLTDERG
jgi:hypothetical protein